jgi:uncharacterized protein YjbJ (UPF0337 family)
MSSSLKNKVKGTLREAQGKLKEVAGKLTDNPKLEAKGTVQKLAGKAERKLGEIKKVVGA